jgi:hypothetical protein
MFSHSIFSVTYSIILLTALNYGKCVVFNNFQWTDAYGDQNYIGDELQAWQMIVVAGVSQKFTICDGVAYAAGFGVMSPNGGFASRYYYSLPTHDMIYFSIFFQILDHWNVTDYFSLIFDTTEVEFRNFVTDSTAFPTNACGESTRKGFQMYLVGKVPHSGLNVTFKIVSHLNDAPTEKSFGFRMVNLLFANTNAPQPQSSKITLIVLVQHLLQ